MLLLVPPKLRSLFGVVEQNTRNMHSRNCCILIALATVSLILPKVCEAVCNRIQISGTQYQQEKEGIYVLRADRGCGDKPIWIHENGAQYIFELDVHDGGVENRWFVGPKYCELFVGLQAVEEGSNDSPLNISANSWHEYAHPMKVWIKSPMTMSCLEPLPEPCRYGSGLYCTALPCHCAESKCDRQTGTCATGACDSGLPPTDHAWHGEACQIGNLAFGQPTNTQSVSSTVDGDITTCTNVTANHATNNAVMSIFLSAAQSVSSFTIYHAPNDVGSGQITVGVSDEGDLSDITICGQYDESTVGDGSVTVQCDNPVVGRFAFVHKTGVTPTSPLGLCEVAVTGHRYIDCSSCPGSCNEITGCDNCPDGLKLPDCKRSCTGGTYGESCKFKCGFCTYGCDPITGVCVSPCHDWWIGDHCTTYIERIPMVEQGIIVEFITATTAVVRWTKMPDVPSDLYNYYEYEVQFNKKNTGWEKAPRVTHDPDTASPYQDTELTDLQANTPYTVKVTSFRVVGSLVNATTETPAVPFETKCGEPNKKPLDVSFVIRGSKVDFIARWETIGPDDIGCNGLSAVTLMYRDLSTTDWRTVEILPTSTTTQSLNDLPKADYIFILKITNNEGFSAVSEKRVDFTSTTKPTATTTTSTVTSTLKPTSSGESSSELNMPMVAGAAAGGLAFLVLIIIVGILVAKVCRRNSPPAPANTIGETKIVVYTGGERPTRSSDEIPNRGFDNPMMARESGIYDSIAEEKTNDYQRLNTLPARH